MTIKENNIIMNPQDNYTIHHKKLLDGHYECADRIVLNDYFPLGQLDGDFRHGGADSTVLTTAWTNNICRTWPAETAAAREAGPRKMQCRSSIVCPVPASTNWHKYICHKIGIIRYCF
jgi:hypothetical protein